jgi:hypothetical protein
MAESRLNPLRLCSFCSISNIELYKLKTVLKDYWICRDCLEGLGIPYEWVYRKCEICGNKLDFDVYTEGVRMICANCRREENEKSGNRKS